MKNVNDLITHFKKAKYPFLSPATQRSYNRVFKNIKTSIGKIYLSRLNSFHVDCLVSFLRSASTQRKSFAYDMQVFIILVNWHNLNSEKRIIKNIFKERHSKKYLKLSDMDYKKMFLTKDEFSKFIKNLDPFYKKIALVQTYQILRISEVLAMRWDYLTKRQEKYYFKFNQYIDFTENKIKFGSKNMKSGDYQVRPLRQKTVEILKELGIKKQGLIFSKDENFISYKSVLRAYNKAFLKSGLEVTSGTHVLRHTGATFFLSETKGDYASLQKLGNWSDIKLTLHYGRVTDHRLDEALEEADKVVLNEIF